MSENTEKTTDFVTEDEIKKAVAELTEDGYLGEDVDTETEETEEDETDLVEKGEKTKKADDEEVEETEETEETETNAVVGNEDESEDESEGEGESEKAESRKERADVDKYEYEEGMVEGMHDKDEENAEKSKKGLFRKSGKGYHRYVSKGGKRFDTNNYVKKGGKFSVGTIKKGEDTYVSEEVESTIEVTPILKSFQDTLSNIVETSDKKFQSTGTILKGLLEQIDRLSEKVDDLSSEPNQRKSATTATYKDRFEKSEDNELSAKTDKYKILDLMDDLTFAKGDVDGDMAKAMTNFEQTNRLPETIALRLEKELGVKVCN